MLQGLQQHSPSTNAVLSSTLAPATTGNGSRTVDAVSPGFAALLSGRLAELVQHVRRLPLLSCKASTRSAGLPVCCVESKSASRGSGRGNS